LLAGVIADQHFELLAPGNVVREVHTTKSKGSGQFGLKWAQARRQLEVDGSASSPGPPSLLAWFLVATDANQQMDI